ncbi:DUF257 family protein [Thermococcus sp.]|uniref:DUF257 family protein n=1 Tax=Thermococcus sp. TaxID=35749 RepID=UPI0026256284|nr:DUF257 family protein [Thermococcus sp.]
MIKKADWLWDSLKPGETVLIEHDSLTSPALGFYYAVKWAKTKGYEVIVDDILDTLYIQISHLKLAGWDIGIVDELKVIKEGGTLKVGNVVARLRLDQYAIRQTQYSRVYEPLISRGGVVNIVLGLDKLFLISDMHDNMKTVNSILSYTGDDRRIALYFINRDLLGTSCPHFLPLLEEIATTVIKVTKEKGRYVFSVVKSINNKLDGESLALP